MTNMLTDKPFHWSLVLMWNFPYLGQWHQIIFIR